MSSDARAGLEFTNGGSSSHGPPRHHSAPPSVSLSDYFFSFVSSCFFLFFSSLSLSVIVTSLQETHRAPRTKTKVLLGLSPCCRITSNHPRAHTYICHQPRPSCRSGDPCSVRCHAASPCENLGGFLSQRQSQLSSPYNEAETEDRLGY